MAFRGWADSFLLGYLLVPLCRDNYPCAGTSRQGGIKGKAKWLVYLNHFITGWDDNIWSFALGLFLVEITPQSLQFTATYGLAAGCAVLLFGTVVGDWVDHTPRLTVARVSVLVQNCALISCSILIYLVLTYKAEISAVWANEALLRLCYVFIVVIAIVSNLTNMARNTAIERDWIVEICNKDKNMLANLSATMRRISLATRVVAPIIIGQILSRTSHPVGALIVAAWNFMTIFLEYFLLWKIYEEVPQLHRLKIKGENMDTRLALMDNIDEFIDIEVMETPGKDDALLSDKETEIKEKLQHEVNGVEHSHTSIDPLSKPDIDTRTSQAEISDGTRQSRKRWQKLFTSCITLHRGWNIYRNYEIVFAGLSLASLYLTVLSFHYITTGFVYSQGLSEDLIGGLRGLAAFFGIIGTVLYPFCRRKFGLQRTGLYAIVIQISSLVLCVISIFAPGSPFDPLFFIKSDTEHVVNHDRESTAAFITTVSAYEVSNGTERYLKSQSILNSTGYSIAVTSTEPSKFDIPTSYVSTGLLLAGMIGSRTGLWMADLTITQLFLETVDVTERGIVNGVQNAINQIMELIKFTIVILLPEPEMFGYLVLISFCFICLAWVLFAVYVNRARGYLLPCSKNESEDKAIR